MAQALRRNTSKIRSSREDKIFDAFNYIILSLVLIAVIYPLWFIFIASFSDPNLVSLGKVMFIPKGITLEGYQKVFEYKQVWVGFRNSVIYTVVFTVISTYLCLAGGYFMSRNDVVGNRVVSLFFIFTMFFSGGLIPSYIVVSGLGLINTIWAVVLPGAVSVYNMIIARTFFTSNLGVELREAAQIDGSSNLRFFYQIAIPLSKTLIAVLVLFHAVSQWNAYFQAMIYLHDLDKQPLQLVLRDILLMNTVDSSMTLDAASVDEKQRIADMLKYVLIIVSSVPMFAFYPFVQKQFASGVMIGAVKG